jgi:hypothetical protein
MQNVAFNAICTGKNQPIKQRYNWKNNLVPLSVTMLGDYTLHQNRSKKKI